MTKMTKAAWALTVALGAGCTGAVGEMPAETPVDTTPVTPKQPPVTKPNTPDSPMGMPMAPSGPCKDATQPCVGGGPMRRLTLAEYTNTVGAVLGFKGDLRTTLPQDERVEGYTANTAVRIEGPTADRYATAAAAVAKAAVLDGLVKCPLASGNEACARTFISEVGARLYRRALEPAQVDRVLAAFRAGSMGATFEAGIRLATEAMLQSPFFLYHVEAGEGTTNPNVTRALSPQELASRLSYFFWDAPPDAELLQAANDKTLSNLPVLRAQAQRLARDARAAKTLIAFVMQWLRVDELEGLDKDKALYPEADDALLASMRAETEETVREAVVTNDGGVAQLLTANFTYVNDALAKLYGLPRVNSTTVKRVPLEARRLGVLSQAGFLATHAHPSATSTVKRGLIIRERLLCNPPPPPPPDAQQMFEADPKLTQRQEFERVLANPTCGGCHVKLDPIGFTFENMDALGKWRAEELPGVPIDASGQLSDTDVDGPVKNAVELVRRLTMSKQVGDCVADNWFPFVMARLHLQRDDHTVAAIRAAYHKSGGKVRDFLVEVVTTDAFRFVSAE